MSMNPNVDYYQTLGVSPQASQAEIKKAYRRLARKYHPDSTGGDKNKEARFKDIQTAYDVLGDSDRRSQYDAMRSGGPRFSAGGAGFDIGDLFSQVFGGGGAGGGPNVRYTYTAGGPFGGSEFFTSEGPFETPFGGGPRGRRSRPRRRRRPEPTERKVQASDGTTLIQRQGDVYSDVRLSIDQAILGTVAEVATIDGTAKVKIPPGTSSGVKLRLKGKGAFARGGRGDHFVTVHIDVPKNIDDEGEKLLQQLVQRIRKK